MYKDELHKALSIDENLSPLPVSKKKSAGTEYLTATIKPALPSGTDSVVADKFVFAELVSGYLSVLGRSGTGAKFQQIGIIIRKGTPGGTYALSDPEQAPVRATFIAEQVISHAKAGTVSFQCDNDSITGTANFQVDFNEQTKHSVEDVKFHLKETIRT